MSNWQFAFLEKDPKCRLPNCNNSSTTIVAKYNKEDLHLTEVCDSHSEEIKEQSKLMNPSK